jgi:hypothetical protein
LVPSQEDVQPHSNVESNTGCTLESPRGFSKAKYFRPSDAESGVGPGIPTSS